MEVMVPLLVTDNYKVKTSRPQANFLCLLSSYQVWWLSTWLILLLAITSEADPTPKPWPLQFHAQLYQNTSGKLSIVDLWYDFPGGRNLNLIQKQLGNRIHDVEWTNGTSYYYDLEHDTCAKFTFEVGILRPDWLRDATYVGIRESDGFQCNVWEKMDFITYYEDIKTQRPVSWLFFTGMWEHVITFEEGNILEDQKWQAPPSCFQQATRLSGRSSSLPSTLELLKSQQPFARRLMDRTRM